MASMYWIKLYHEILDDPKMGRLPDHLWRRSIEIFLLAGETDQGGYLPPVGDMAWKLRSTEQEVEECLVELAKINITRKGVDGRWFVIHFEERQDKDSHAERQARYREKQRKSQQSVTGDVTLSHIDIDIDKDINKKEGARTEENPPEEYEPTPLSDKYTEITKTLPYKLPDWIEANQTMTRAGVTPEELELAIKKMDDDGMQYSGLWSVVKTAVWVHSRKAAGKPVFSDPPRRGSKRASPEPPDKTEAEKAAEAAEVARMRAIIDADYEANHANA